MCLGDANASLLQTSGLALAYASGADLRVAVSVAGSLLAILVFASLVGAFLPLAARALHIDPAMVSGPLLSTLVDTVGLLIYFAIAGLVLR